MSNTYYTFCDKVGHRIFTRARDKDGKLYQNVISEHPFELFIPGNRKDAVGFYGEPLSRVTFDSVSDMQDFVKQYDGVTEIHGQTSAAHQYIASKWGGDITFDINHFKILNFDIEVESRNGFPAPETAADVVTSISMKVFGSDKCITLGLKDYSGSTDGIDYIYCANEKDLLRKFLTEWRRIDPDIITGWNIEGFDIPYLVNRITSLLGEEEAARLSPFYRDTKHPLQQIQVNKKDTSYRILGVTMYDYLPLYQKFNPVKLESYKLSFVCDHEEVEGKVDWAALGFRDLNDLYDKDFNTFIEYNARDVLAVENLDKKLKFILCAVNIVYMTHSRFVEALGTVRIWDNYVYNMLKADGIPIPPEREITKDHDIIGAYVKDPEPGFKRWLVSLDMTSLYPSICMMYNMSPETLRYKAADNPVKFMEGLMRDDRDVMSIVNERKQAGLCTASNGSSYSQEKKGIIPRGMKFLFDTRKEVKTRMKDAKKKAEAMKQEGKPKHLIALEEAEVEKLDAYQQALKVVANGGYGALSNQHFRYFNLDIAEGITLSGQMSIKYASAALNKFLNEKLKTTARDYVAYTDTDSCYVSLDTFVTKMLGVKDATPAMQQKVADVIDIFVKKEIDPMLNEAWAKLSDKVGSINNTMNMKRESIADVGIFRARKNYIIEVIDNEGVRYTKPKLKAVGVEIAKTSTPLIVRDALKHCVHVMLRGNNAELIDYVKQFKDDFMHRSMKDIAFPRGVSSIRKWVTGSGQIEKGAPINSRGAIVFNRLVSKYNLTVENPIREGDKIRYVYLKEPNPVMSNVVAFHDDLPKEFNLDQYVDKDLQWDKTFVSPLKSFTDIIGWEVVKRQTLDDMWS